MNPVVRNMALVTTGTARPANTGSRWTLAGSGGRLPSAICQRITLSTPDSWRIRKPVIPCRDGGRPVVIEVSAAGVVDGTTVVIGPPAKAPSSGNASGKRARASQPRPSSTSSTEARAPSTGAGSHGTGRRPISAGTTPATFGPE